MVDWKVGQAGDKRTGKTPLSVYLGSNLVSALASLDVDDLTHLESLVEKD
jgi:regulator of PEP synthase PpsR (kinase-PPPase family)